MKKNKWQSAVIVITALILLFLLNFISSRKSPAEQVKNLISQHRGALLFVRSGTSADKEFMEALKEARSMLKGTAGIVVAGANSGLLEEGELLPVLIVFDAHGNLLAKMSGVPDREMLKDAVHAIMTHTH